MMSRSRIPTKERPLMKKSLLLLIVLLISFVRLSLAQDQDYFQPLGNQSFQGKITDVIYDDRMVIVRYNMDTSANLDSDDYEQVNCYVANVTQLTKDGKPISFDDLHEGQKVHVDIMVDEDGHRVTNVINVLSKEDM